MDTGRLINADYGRTVDGIVIALCKDYERRKDLINGKRCTVRTAMEYKYINYMLKSAADEIVGPREGEIYIKEIGEGCGYAKSGILYSSETAYKRSKKEIKVNIARKLHLID